MSIRPESETRERQHALEKERLMPRFQNSRTLDDAQIPCHLVHTFCRNPLSFGEV